MPLNTTPNFDRRRRVLRGADRGAPRSRAPRRATSSMPSSCCCWPTTSASIAALSEALAAARAQRAAQRATREGITMNDSELRYQTGFGNEFASRGRARRAAAWAATARSRRRAACTPSCSPAPPSPRRAPRTAAPGCIAASLRWWAAPMRRTRSRCGPAARSAASAMPPDPLRWNPFRDSRCDRSTSSTACAPSVANGDVQAQIGMAAHVYTANRSMQSRVLVNADGEMLFVPQQGAPAHHHRARRAST